MLTVAVAESDDNALNNAFSVFYICVLSQKKKKKIKLNPTVFSDSGLPVSKQADKGPLISYLCSIWPYSLNKLSWWTTALVWDSSQWVYGRKSHLLRIAADCINVCETSNLSRTVLLFLEKKEKKERKNILVLQGMEPSDLVVSSWSCLLSQKQPCRWSL